MQRLNTKRSRPTPGVEAIVLAGGQSSRMGRDKSKLRIGKRSLASWAKRAALEAGIPARILRRDCVAKCGPMGGMWTALRKTKVDACLFLACDMPMLKPSLLVRMVKQFHKTGSNIAILESNRWGFPWLIRSVDANVLKELIERGELSLQKMGTSLKLIPLRLNVRERTQRISFNTWQEWIDGRERRHQWMKERSK